jgi:hypothetical protein
MMKIKNETHIEGYLYEHKLEMRESGPKSKNPGTKFIMGTVDIATDNNLTNIVSVHFSYVTATTAKGSPNATYTTLENIVNGKYGSVMANGKDGAVKLRIDSAIALNEFFSDRNGQEELVSVKRNEGGFVHVVTGDLTEDEKLRSTFKCDMVITNVTRVEANEDQGTPEKVIVKGAIFDFRKALLPVEFVATNDKAMDYFEGLGATKNEPVFTCLWGRQISETITTTVTEESAFGEPSVREVKRSRKEYLITGASPDTHVWDDESTMTAEELKKAVAEREVYLAGVKARQDEYKASKNAPAVAAAPANSAFNF